MMRFIYLDIYTFITVNNGTAMFVILEQSECISIRDSEFYGTYIGTEV